MSVVHLSEKYPNFQPNKNLRIAVHKMQSALDDQRSNMNEFQGSLSQLGDIMKDLKQSFKALDRNLGNVRIGSLGRKSRRLAQIMDGSIS